MLQELTITDFAIIRQVRLELAAGLVVFTGETGAGKSIVLDAIGALLGDRLGPEVVRTGAARATVEGLWHLPWLPGALAALRGAPDEPAEDETADARPDARHHLAALLRELGLDDEDATLIISREIAASGRGTARVNGRAVPLSALARLGALLVDVHGQGAHLTLLRPDQHVNFLDRFAETLAERRDLAAATRRWQGLRRELAQLRQDERELERRADLLRYQVDEIDAAHLRPGEDAELERERTVLNNAERLREASALAHAALAGAADGETPGALDLLGQAQRALSELARFDDSVADLRAGLDEALYRLEDVAAGLRVYHERAEADPARLAEIEERLDRLTRLRRKYGATVEAMLAFGATAARELEGIERRDERAVALEGEIERQRGALGQRAVALAAKRAAAGERLSVAMEAALGTLNMRRARFVTQIERAPNADGVPGPDGARVALTASGIDRVEFLIAPNLGEPPRPLAKIASGGETARLMLALTSILAEADTTPTLIFDEVDAGISGLTGQIVGEMLWRLGQAHQVLCVTHLPQLAAFADQHWHVAKRVAEERTTTVVTDLALPARTLELAQMLGGVATETAARNAAELLDRAATWKLAPTSPDAPPPSANGHAGDQRASRRRSRAINETPA